MLLLKRRKWRLPEPEHSGPWFAWRPVEVHEGWVWWETVWRSRHYKWDEWNYKRLSQEDDDAPTPV